MKKNKRNSRLVIITSALLGLGTLGFFLIPFDTDLLTNEDISIDNNVKDKSAFPTIQSKSKEPIKVVSKTKRNQRPKSRINGRKILGHHNINTDAIILTNKISKNPLIKYQANFERMLGDQKAKNFKIELKRSVIKLSSNKFGRYLEHVLVSYIKPDGEPYSFEAYIDSQTAQVVQSWNKTHYEFRTPAALTGHVLITDN